MYTCGASAGSDLVDTNVLVAAARTADTNHRAAAQLLRTLDDTLVVTPGVIAETCYLLHEFGGARPEVEFLRSIATGDLDLAELTSPTSPGWLSWPSGMPTSVWAVPTPRSSRSPSA